MREEPGVGVETEAKNTTLPNRRRMLMLGAASVSAVVTIKPALASTAASVLDCDIPVPDPKKDSGKWIAPDGTLVDPRTPGSFAPPPRPIKGEDFKNAIRSGQTYPGARYDASKAYTNYIRRLQQGSSGFTCFASLQMPRG